MVQGYGIFQFNPHVLSSHWPLGTNGLTHMKSHTSMSLFPVANCSLGPEPFAAPQVISRAPLGAAHK